MRSWEALGRCFLQLQYCSFFSSSTDSRGCCEYRFLAPYTCLRFQRGRRPASGVETIGKLSSFAWFVWCSWLRHFCLTRCLFARDIIGYRERVSKAFESERRDQEWTSIPSKGSSNTPRRFIVKTPENARAFFILCRWSREI